MRQPVKAHCRERHRSRRAKNFHLTELISPLTVPSQKALFMPHMFLQIHLSLPSLILATY